MAAIRVMVKQGCKGYYNHKRRYEGEVFLIKCSNDFSDTWMEKVDRSIDIGMHDVRVNSSDTKDVIKPGKSEEVFVEDEVKKVGRPPKEA